MKTFYLPARSASLLLILGLLFQVSCSVQPSLDELSPGTDSKVLIQFIENNLVCGSKAVYKHGNYVINNDMFMTEQDVRDRYNKSVRSSNARQTSYQYLVSDTYINNINVYIPLSTPSNVQQAAIGAINDFNSVGNTKLRFYLTDESSSANITVNTITGDNGGYAYLPNYIGKPGHDIYISSNSTYYTNPNTLKSLVAHELAHAIGLCHTPADETSTNCSQIPGTPVSDQNSVMAGFYDGVYTFPTNSYPFSQGDIDAIRILYPNNISSPINIGVVFRDRTYSPLDPNGSEYSTAFMYITLTDANGNPVNSPISGLTVRYKESNDYNYGISTYETASIPFGASEVYIGEKALDNITCSDPQHCSGTHYYAKVIPADYYRPRATYYP